MRLDAAATERVVDAALDAGINFFDTADVYGGTQSEEFLGRALADAPRSCDHRHEVRHARWTTSAQGARPAYVRQACEDSLRRLGTDYIDLYQLHQPDPTVPIADTLGALDDLVQAGKVREIGCSNFSAEQLRDGARREGRRRAIRQRANEYSLLHREPERRVLPECERQGLAFLPYFPLASGCSPASTRPQAGARRAPAAAVVDARFTHRARTSASPRR